MLLDSPGAGRNRKYSPLKTLARWVLAAEPYLLILTLCLFWLTPERLEFLLLFVPGLIARVIVYRRLWTLTPIDGLLVALVILILLNYYFAPYTRSLWIGSRALMGVPLVFCIVEFARRRGNTNRLIMGTILLGLLIGVLGITSAQWSDKSTLLKPILDLLPTIRNFPGAAKGFNVNEIAGAMIWLLPLTAGVAIYSWRNPEDAGSPRRFYATLTFVVLFIALFLGQSRLAILGMVVALAILIFALIPANKWRVLALISLVIFSVVEIVLFIGVFSPDEALEARDEASFTSRVYIWQSAIEMIVDYPLTGVGMNKYRLTPVRERYPVRGYENRILPHAHNEWLQIGADLGIPGILLLAGWHLGMLYMSVRIWQRGDAYERAIGISLLAGLIAHGAFGMGDAVTLWDRFSFVFWLLIGLTAAQYVVTVRLAQKSTSDRPTHHTAASGAASSPVAT